MTEWEAWASENAGLVQHKKSRAAAEKAFQDQQEIIESLREIKSLQTKEMQRLEVKCQSLLETIIGLEDVKSTLKS